MIPVCPTRRFAIRGQLRRPLSDACEIEAEYLSYEEDGVTRNAVIYLNWKARANVKTARQRQFVSVEVRSGANAEGPMLDPQSRNLLCATHMRPLRDAERALSAGRGSRLSQILQFTEEIADGGEPYDDETGPPDELENLSVLGIGDFANALLKRHSGLVKARDRLNDEYLKNLSFSGSVTVNVFSASFMN